MAGEADGLTDADCVEAHVLAKMLADNPGDRRVQETAWALIGRLRREGKIYEAGDGG